MTRGPAAFAAVLAVGATAASVKAYAAAEAFDPVTFFTGATHGEGRLKEAFKREKRVTVDSVGHADKDGLLLLDQKVAVEGEPLRLRHWRLREVAPGRYTGTISSATSPVEAQAMGQAIRIRYSMEGGIKVETWLTALPGGRTVQNKTSFSKWGFKVASITERIEKR